MSDGAAAAADGERPVHNSAILQEELTQSAYPEVVTGPSSPPADIAVSDQRGLAPSFVYAVGQLELRCPSLGIEKEVAQATGRSEAARLTDQQAMQALLSDRANRYLVRQLVWVLSIEGLETYILVPRDPADFDLLVDSLRPTPRATDIDVVIGVRGQLAPSDFAGGLILPLVAFDQLYSFDIDSLINGIPRPDGMSAEDFEPAAEDLYNRIAQIADNAGSSDEHRALNYLAVRYPAIYAEAARALERNSTISAVRARPSRLSGARKIVDVVFLFRNRNTDVEEAFFVRVDVTEEFPFLVTKLAPYYERT